MSWRNAKTHRQETKEVKEALTRAGIAFKSVGHGTGTAWAWLEINLGPEASYELQCKAIQVAKEATGRSGDWDGDIVVVAGRGWGG